MVRAGIGANCLLSAVCSKEIVFDYHPYCPDDLCYRSSCCFYSHAHYQSVGIGFLCFSFHQYFGKRTLITCHRRYHGDPEHHSKICHRLWATNDFFCPISPPFPFYSNALSIGLPYARHAPLLISPAVVKWSLPLEPAYCWLY